MRVVWLQFSEFSPSKCCIFFSVTVKSIHLQGWLYCEVFYFMFIAFKFTDCCLIHSAFVKPMAFLSMRIEIQLVDQNIHSRLS